VPRHEFVDAALLVAVDERREGSGEVVLRIDVVELRGLYQRSDDAPVAAALVMTGEERVLAAQGDRADGSFDGIGVDLVVCEECSTY
jgi:hypothetical protein